MPSALDVCSSFTLAMPRLVGAPMLSDFLGVLSTDRVRLACCVRRSRRLDEWLFPARARFDLESTSPRVKPALPASFACDWTSLLVPTLTVCRTVRGAQT